MKKTLFALLVCIILLAGATFVSSATEVNTEPWVEDLSLATGTHTYAFNPEANNRINYVVTGSNPDAEIYVWGSCNITLRNASFRRLHIDYEDSYTVNITLEGENTINQYNWASQGALEIYSSQVTINGGENDSLYARSKAFTVYSNSHDQGSLTVNGGNCTFEAFDTSTPFQTTYIQNGGNVKVIGTSYCFLYNLTLNAGSLDILGKSSSSPPFRDEVYIKKGASFKVSLTSNTLNGWGQFNLAEGSGANDCMFVRFDDSSEFIYLSDGNSEINDKSYMEIKVIEHIHACENGVCPCGFVCEHNTDGGVCGICGKYIYKIAHQPTAAEPYVSLNDGTGASYQWYEVSGIKEITDNDGVMSVRSMGGFPYAGEGSYSESDGWTGVGESYEYEGVTEYASYYFLKSFNAGDKVIVNASAPVYFEFFGTNTDWYYEVFDEMTTEIRFTVEETGIYCIGTYSLNESPTLRVYEGDIQETAVAGQTASALTKLSYGRYYYCSVTAADGTVLRSDWLDNSYKIIHHPTDMQQYITLNDSTSATYRWYLEKEGIVPVTDENDVSFEVLGAPPEIGGVYDSENGWYPDEYGDYFTVEMKAGDVLTLEFSQTPEEIYYLYSSEDGTVENEIDITGAASFTAPSDGYYGIWAANGGTLKATLYGISYFAEEGQTEASLTPGELGKYYCEVTFADGTKERSDIVEVQHLHSGGTATCKVKAECSVCGIKYGSVNASNHVNTKNENAVSATCTKVGYTAGVYCNDCKKWASGHTLIKVKGHTFTEKIIDSKHLKSAATASSPAVYKYDCANCNAISPNLTFKHGNKLGVFGKATKITATQSTSSVKLTWTAVDGANIYRVYQKNGSSWKKLGDVTKLNGTIKNLKAGTKYTFAVKAGAKIGNKITWAKNYTTIATATKAVKPSKVTAAQNTSTIKLTWTKVAGATGYRIYVKSGSSWKTLVSSTTATSYTIKNLKAGTKYTYAVRPYIKTASGVVWSDYTQLTTATKPAKVTAKVSSPSKGKVTLTWNAVKGAETYQVYYKTGNGSYKLYKTYTGVKNLTFKNLKSGTKYTFAVRAGIKTSSGYVYGGYNAATVTVK